MWYSMDHDKNDCLQHESSNKKAEHHLVHLSWEHVHRPITFFCFSHVRKWPQKGSEYWFQGYKYILVGRQIHKDGLLEFSTNRGAGKEARWRICRGSKLMVPRGSHKNWSAPSVEVTVFSHIGLRGSEVANLESVTACYAEEERRMQQCIIWLMVIYQIGLRIPWWIPAPTYSKERSDAYCLPLPTPPMLLCWSIPRAHWKLHATPEEREILNWLKLYSMCWWIHKLTLFHFYLKWK